MVIGGITLTEGSGFGDACKAIIPEAQQAEFLAIIGNDEVSFSEASISVERYDEPPAVRVGVAAAPPTTDRQRTYAYQTAARKEFFDSFTHLFSKQLHIWHHLDHGLANSDGGAISKAGGLLAGIADGCGILGAGLLVGGIVALYKWQDTRQLQDIAGQNAIRRSYNRDEVSKLSDMLLHAYRGVIDSFDTQTRLKPPKRGLTSAFMGLLTGKRGRVGKAEYLAILVNTSITDHISRSLLLDDISLHKQLFAVAAVSMERNLGLVLPSGVDIEEDFPVVKTLRSRFASTLRSSHSMRDNIGRIYAEGLMDEASPSSKRTHTQRHHRVFSCKGT